MKSLAHCSSGRCADRRLAILVVFYIDIGGDDRWGGRARGRDQAVSPAIPEPRIIPPKATKTTIVIAFA